MSCPSVIIFQYRNYLNEFLYHIPIRKTITICVWILKIIFSLIVLAGIQLQGGKASSMLCTKSYVVEAYWKSLLSNDIIACLHVLQ